MRRFLVSGLLLSHPLRRLAAAATTTYANTSLLSLSRGFASTCSIYRNSSNNPSIDSYRVMEEPFKTMEEAGVPECDKPSEAAAPQKEEQDLPKLSAKEFRVYNRMAEHMDMFHESFRQTWNQLYNACSSGKRPAGMSIRAFLSTAEQFCHHLTMHHTIEEQHIFPVLARKQPAFRKELELLTHHKMIHEGLEKLEVYLAECKSGEKELRMGEMKVILDGFGAVLWEHLDAEVKELRAENMRKYWTVQEMQRMPM
jgi:hypothetical protein